MTDLNRVLIVDDNEINGMLALQLIEAFELAGDLAYSGEEAIEKIKNNKYAFILMDHVMPGMSGVEATAIIHKMTDTPIYAMTGDLTMDVELAFIEAGAAEAVAKPIKPTRLLEIIRSCISEGSYSVNDVILGQAPTQNDEDANRLTVKSFLASVSGLDFDTGIRNALGSEKSYLRVINAAADNIRQYVDILSEYLINRDPKALKLASHSLKTVFANVGFGALRDESEHIESIARDHIRRFDEQGIAGVPFDDNHQFNIGRYIGHTRQAADQLEAALADYNAAVRKLEDAEESTEAEAPLTEEELKQVFDYTRRAIQRFEVDYVTEGLEMLKKATIGEVRRNVSEAIEAAQMFDYEKAEQKLEEIYDAVCVQDTATE